jgi:signal transduction histidine kinase
MDIDILEQINRSSIRFLQPLTPEDTYKVIIEEALKLVKGDEGYIALAEDGELKIKYAYPMRLSEIKMRKRGYSYTSYKKRKAFVTYAQKFDGVNSELVFKGVHPELVKAGIQSTIFIPLSNQNESIGVMNIMSKHSTKKFSNKELSVLKLFGAMASMAIRKTQLYSEVKSALENRDLFLSMAAHEFRTPITTISGYAQLLRNKIKAETSEKRWVEEIYKEVQRLSRLVNELLEINRLRSGQLRYNWQECNLFNILNKVIAGFTISHPDRYINLKSEVGESGTNIVGDEDKIIQVLINVLDNAAKFSPPDKIIDVSLKNRDDELVIQVKDYGHGIAPRDLQKVFEGFYRGVNNSKEGMGLGLYISYQIVKEHRGAIYVKSKIDHGTTIEIRFPKTKIKRIN